MDANKVIRVNGQFQQWLSLLQNRTKRTQSGKFIVQGVRPINSVINQSLVVDAVLRKEDGLSDWAKGVLKQVGSAKTYSVTSELMSKLGEKTDDIPELILIVKTPSVALSEVKLNNLRSKFILILDRLQSPGNIGAIARSADALGAAMVILTGHSADAYDPKSIRTSRGSLFAIPVVIAASHSEVIDWCIKQGQKFSIIGLSEDGNKNLWDIELHQPTLAVIGSETWGLSKQWKEACTDIVSIPMQGTASSLNAASSAAITLYEYSKRNYR